MQLPSDILAEIASSTNAGSLRTGPERRRGRRYPCATKAEVERQGGRSQLRVGVRDIAVGGVSLQCNEPLRVGERFTLVLPRRDGKSITVDCICTRWFPIAAKTFLVGASFDQIIKSEAA